MDHKRSVLIIDESLDELNKPFKEVFRGDWHVFMTCREEEAKELFIEHEDLDVVIIGYDICEQSSLGLLEFIRDLDENIALFFMDDDPRNTFSAYESHKYRALPYFIHKDELIADPASARISLLRHYDEHITRLCTPRMKTEYGRLRSVLVHEPSDEINRIDPDFLPYFLFESLPSGEMMARQHREFVSSMRRMGRRPLVIDVRLLLYEVLRDAGEVDKRQIVENCLYGHELSRITRRFARQNLPYSPLMDHKFSELCTLPPLDLTDMMFCGLNVADFLSEEAHAAMYTRRECQVVEPVPNMYFMRDPGFVLDETFYFSRMFRKIRRRETNILREVVRRHPHLRGMRNNSFDLDEKSQDAVSVEGGDTMCIAPGHFAVAESERTTRGSIRRVAEQLFLKDGVEKLYQPLIPPKRAYIHLDTVCSLAGPDAAIVHTEAFAAYSETLLWTKEVVERGAEPISLGMNFIEILRHEFGKELIQAAGGGSRARLEQFDDATNVFMVNPETPMVYDRNTETNKILEQFGFKLGLFSGSDLVMGRGGARCMTMPLHRD